MGIWSLEIGVPGVEMSIEVNQGDRAMNRVGRPQGRKCNRVIAAECQHRSTVGHQLGHTRLDVGERLPDVERVAGNVARVDHLGECERHGILRRVERSQ